MEIVLYMLLLVAGFALGWFFKNASATTAMQQLASQAQERYNGLDKEFISFRSSAMARLEGTDQNLKNEQAQHLICKNERETAKEQLSGLRAALESAQDKLKNQKEEMQGLREDFQKEFKLVANKLLEDNSKKFSDQSKESLSHLLNPLGENLKEFKTKVEEVYIKEAKERFSLGERVKELAELNQQVSKEARNLTEALKSETKTQGRWGEIILENILEKSGLERGREYFMEHELKGEDGKHLRSVDGKKMRPDAVIKYPDNRSVIIDSKVSLNAYVRAVETDDSDTQAMELASHVKAIKQHINSLSTKGYDNYDSALDFVMLFIPNEAAYIAAIRKEPDLWNYAYDRRILLLSPTNLITSLKLIVDLWKREYQNLNAEEIANQGSKLYDKFVGFVDNLEQVGHRLDQAQQSYDKAHGQLVAGHGNLVGQAQKLKDLGVSPKKSIPNHLLHQAGEQESSLP